MDPNEALKRLRDLMEGLKEAADSGDDIDHDDVGDAVNVWEGLDHWLSGKGFLPKDWQRSTGEEQLLTSTFDEG